MLRRYVDLAGALWRFYLASVGCKLHKGARVMGGVQEKFPEESDISVW